MTAASIPAWQQTELASLANSGDLYGLPPSILAGIDQAESSGQGGSINSAGYGGYFGLGANSSYAAGQSSPSLLESTTPQAFGDQAVLAASDFAGLLAQYGGDVYRAEAAYQTGPNSGVTGGTEGDQVFANLGVPATAQPTTTAQTTSINWKKTATSIGTSIGSAAGGPLGAAVGGGVASLLTGGWEAAVFKIVLEGVFVAAALGLIMLGLTRLFPGAVSTIKTALPLAA